MTSKSLGLYVHIPFCLRKCNYCDFCSYAGVDPKTRRAYLQRLSEQIRLFSDRAREYTVDTLYFGGGTPSLLSPEELTELVGVIRESYRLSGELEFTVEVNPKTLTREKVDAFVRCGVNRVSMGLQSIHENEQKILGRVHNFEDFLLSYQMLLDGGIDNISVDLMYAIPEQTLSTLDQTLDAVLALSPKHISAYSLILEEDTPFDRMRDTLPLPSEDEELQMYERLCARLAARGYEHYEIASYARAGHYSRHNLRYWSLSPYLGFGVAAHSYFEGERFYHPRDLSAYLLSDAAYYECERERDPEADAYEYAMLALRTRRGLDLSDYRTRFGKCFTEGKEEKLSRLVREGYMILTKDRMAFTERGIYLSLAILSEIL